MAEENIQWAWY